MSNSALCFSFQDLADFPTIVYNISPDLYLKCLDNQKVEDDICRSRSNKCGVVKAVESHSDLIPNVYEGKSKR